MKKQFPAARIIAFFFSFPLLLCFTFLSSIKNVRAAVPPSLQTTLQLQLRDIPGDGLVVSEISLQGLRQQLGNLNSARVRLASTENGRPVPSRWVPDPEFDGKENFSGTLLTSLPGRKSATLQLSVDAHGSTPRAVQPDEWFSTGSADVQFDGNASAIFPTALKLHGQNETLREMEWNTRIYNREEGAFSLRFDKNARLQVLSDGAIATVLRGRANYVTPDGKVASGAPYAIFDWFLFKNKPLIYVVIRQGATAQLAPNYWSENHTLEWNWKGNRFDSYSSDVSHDPVALVGKEGSWSSNRWAALSGSTLSVAMLGSKGLIYDGGADYGKYLQLMEPHGWEDWGGAPQKTSTWLRISDKTPTASELETETALRGQRSTLDVEVNGVSSLTAKLRANVAKLPQAERPAALWRIGVQERLVNDGWLALDTLKTTAASPEVQLVRSGALGLGFFVRPDGIRLLSTYDFGIGKELLAKESTPLLEIMVRKNRESATTWLSSEKDWDSCRFTPNAGGGVLRLSRTLAPNQNLVANITLRKDDKLSQWNWSLDLQNQTREWSVDKVTFPQATLGDWGKDMKLFLPYAAGWEWQDLFASVREFRGGYPSNACMQYMAAYRNDASKTGLYFGRYDATASAKDINAITNPSAKQLMWSYSQPAENATVPGNTFTYQGTAVWRLMRGDWFDASKIYRAWAKSSAPWWPEMKAGERTTSPDWFKKLDAWMYTGGPTQTAKTEMERVRQLLQVPVGGHWYVWHQIPHDNDYPHYFPAKEDFSTAVQELQPQGIPVMPYVNARLWDTRDKGAQDWEYSNKALPWTVKLLADGVLKPQTEESFPKESDGSQVLLGVMCPATQFWEKTITDVTTRLGDEVGVKGIYLDQIAAAAPVGCMDPTHGHPLGGGHWWVDAYNDMLKQVKSTLPRDTILTSECNAEPYMKNLDGFLVWNWQYEGMVPAFPAVYAGAVQFFGRNYGYTGEDIDLGMRMKAAQSLTFGEQMGWCPPDLLLRIANETTRQHFARLVQTRHHFGKYFYAGEMARPPQLPADVPTLTADWQWSGQGKITLPSVSTGAWRLPAESRTLLLFSNASENAVSTSYQLDAAQFGLSGKAFQLLTHNGTAAPTRKTVAAGKVIIPLQIPALSTVALELTP